jgi:hypothetical protein
LRDSLQKRLKDMEKENPSLNYSDPNYNFLTRSLFQKVQQIPQKEQIKESTLHKSYDFSHKEGKERFLGLFLESCSISDFIIRSDIIVKIDSKFGINDEELEIYSKVFLGNVVESAYDKLLSGNYGMGIESCLEGARRGNNRFPTLSPKEYIIELIIYALRGGKYIEKPREIKYREHPTQSHSFEELFYGIKREMFTEEQLKNIERYEYTNLCKYEICKRNGLF